MKLEDQIAVMQAFKGTPICEVFDNPGEDEGDVAAVTEAKGGAQ